MSEHKSFIIDLAETIERHLPRRATDSSSGPQHHWLRMLGRQMVPNLGTLILVAIMLLTIPAIAAPYFAPTAASITTIPYQGRLADAAGLPITSRQNMEFRLYDTPTSSTPLWSEFWTGGNAVNVSDGLFSVMLGSINTGLSAVVQSHSELYLGITIGTDTEMSPRVQLGSVPFSLWSLTVADNSITAPKIAAGVITTTHLANGSVTQAKLGADVSLIPPDGSITTAKIATGAITTTHLANGTVTQAKLGADVSLIPPDGSITTAKIADGAATSRKTRLSNGKVVATQTYALPTTFQDVPGIQVTVSPQTAQTYLVFVTADFLVQNGTAVAQLNVDGAAPAGSQAILSGDTVRATVAQIYSVNLAPGTHTFTLKAALVWGTAATLYESHTGIMYMAVSQ